MVVADGRAHLSRGKVEQPAAVLGVQPEPSARVISASWKLAAVVDQVSIVERAMSAPGDE